MFRDGYWVQNTRWVAPSPVAHRVDEVCLNERLLGCHLEVIWQYRYLDKDGCGLVESDSRLKNRMPSAGGTYEEESGGEGRSLMGGASSRVQVGTRRIVP